MFTEPYSDRGTKKSTTLSEHNLDY